MRKLCILLVGAIVASAGQTTLVQAQQDPNDPWPQYGHDERNTCNSPYRGPHAMPELLWWDELPGEVGNDHRGAAIARFDGETYVFAVGAESVGGVAYARLYQYQARPPSSHTPGSEWAPVWTSDLMRTADDGGACDGGDPVLAENTPAVLRDASNGHVLVVVQTTDDVRAYDRTSGGTSPIWCTPNVVSGRSCGASSPCYGLESASGGAFIYVTGKDTAGQTLLRKISPSDGSVVWTFGLGTSRITTATPSIGSISFTPPTGLEGSNVVYLTTCDGGHVEHDFHGVFAGGAASTALAGRGNISNPLGWPGTFASPSIYANGDIVVGADDARVYGLSSTPVAGEYQLRWPSAFFASSCISATASIWETGGTRRVLFNTEWLCASCSGGVHCLRDAGSTCLNECVSPFSALPVDLHSLVGNTGLSDALGRYCHSGGSSGVLCGYTFPSSTPYGCAWVYTPPADKKLPAYGAVSMDEYGILYLINSGYILALRPTFGDFDGDGVVGSTDCADDVCAYLLYRSDPDAWETQFGSVYGINVLGIGDANNDGLINNLDLADLAAVWDCSSTPTCP